PGAISVEGVGKGGGTAAAFKWIVNAPLVVYWGDMDADGLEILDGFRAADVPARSILMDVDAYKEWERFGTDLDPKGRPLTSRDSRRIPYLTAGERALYERLIAPAWTGPGRVEQERVPLRVALGHVQRLTQG
ncbi:MAG: Wadjet anti-phage system protein JetD domain-containing protein, partial [Streptosporangiaceae bacterium]